MPTGHYERKRSAPRAYLICEQCGKNFDVYECTHKANSTKFCSVKCYAESRKVTETIIEVSCITCGKTITRRVHKLGEKSYCSRECRGTVGMVEVICTVCGINFKKFNSQVGMSNYCSKECKLTTKPPEKIKKPKSPPLWGDKEYVKEYNKKWRENNPNYANESYKKNREKILRMSKIRHENDPTKRTSYMIRRRARENELPDVFTTEDWRFCLNYWSNSCVVCGRSVGENNTIAADHWIPLSHPESPGTVPWNIIPLCHGEKGCNNSKGNKQPIEWLIKKIGESDASILIDKVNEYFSLF